MQRRRHQKGSIRKRGDGWWAVRWREYYIHPQTGVERSKYKQELWSEDQYPNKRQVQRALEERLREINSADYKPLTASTLKTFAEKWERTVLVHTKPSNQASSKSHLKVHLLPAFGDWPLTEITTEVLQEWISKQTAEGKHSATTIRHVLETLRSVMTTARKWNYVRHKPFEDLDIPKKGKAKTYAFSLQETRDIIEAAQEPWKTLIRIVAESGVRSGEVAGLRIVDFDPIGLTISVQQSVWNKRIQEPKTQNAVRREPISASLAEAIQQHISRSSTNQYGLLFTGQTGQPLDMIHFINIVFRPILVEIGLRTGRRLKRIVSLERIDGSKTLLSWMVTMECLHSMPVRTKPTEDRLVCPLCEPVTGKLDELGIRQCGLHALRRMNGTQMDSQNVPMVTRQARLGHAHPSTTLHHYTKPIDAASRQFADRMGEMLAPKQYGESIQ